MKEMSLFDRMKLYENFNKQYLMPNQYVLMRLDGKSFSKFTKKYFIKPFDYKFIEMMQDTAEYLFRNISGCIAVYVQSDEITLLLTDFNHKGKKKCTKFSEGWFNYRVDKMCSVAASMATAKFNQLLMKKMIGAGINSIDEVYKEIDKNPLPVFDCRVWNVPNEDEAKNVFLWRQRDCVRNSVLQYAQSFYSHKELMNKNIDEIKSMLIKSNSDWEKLPTMIKYGTFMFRLFGEYSDKYEIVQYSELMNIPGNNVEYQFIDLFSDIEIERNNIN